MDLKFIDALYNIIYLVAEKHTSSKSYVDLTCASPSISSHNFSVMVSRLLKLLLKYLENILIRRPELSRLKHIWEISREILVMVLLVSKCFYKLILKT